MGGRRGERGLNESRAILDLLNHWNIRRVEPESWDPYPTGRCNLNSAHLTRQNPSNKKPQSMSQMLLFAQTEDWLANWMTPMWLLGLGMLGGLVILAVLWILGLILSRIPGLNTVLETPASRKRVALVVTLVSLVGLAVGVVMLQRGSDWSTALATAIPIAASCWLGMLALVSLCSRRAVEEILLTVKEGPLAPILLVAGLLALFGIFAPLAVNRPQDFVQSVLRLHAVGTSKVGPITIPGTASAVDGRIPEHTIPVSFRRGEIVELKFTSDEPVRVTTSPADEMPAGVTFDVSGGEPYRWLRSEQSVNPFVDETVSQLYVQNMGQGETSLQVTVVTQPQHPQVWLVLAAALSLVGVCLVYLVQRTLAPRLSAVALATIKSEMGQPLLPILLALGFFFLTLSMFIPYNTFGEDIKMLKDSGLYTVMALSIILVVWTASTTVSEEIEGRTALTVLSKPINRRAFLSGKFVGIIWTAAIVFVILGAYLLLLVAYKPIYDAKESSEAGTTWELCFLEMVRTIPGLVLGFFETVVMAALSVAIATRLTMLANFVLCFAIYTLGHMTPLIVQSSVGRFEIVSFVGQLLAVIFPNLEHFNIQAAVAAGVGVPAIYLGWALIYCVIYSTVAMLLALLLFEDRDLA
jgi:ABC-type transport system involved in multi-copper enzyme maturation permease subunit